MIYVCHREVLILDLEAFYAPVPTHSRGYEWIGGNLTQLTRLVWLHA
jgi:hypothetical protein